MSEGKGTPECTSCNLSDCASRGTGQAPPDMKQGESSKDYAERKVLESRLGRIKHKIMVLSGKGGVGKSTVAANLAIALSATGKKVGLMDIDIHGPSIPKMLGLTGQAVTGDDKALNPVPYAENLTVMSIGFLVRNPDSAIIWRGPLKYGAIRQFLKDVNWGDLDYLVVDAPPGTGDEPLSVAQLMPNSDGAVIVTTPQQVAVADVRKCVKFCAQVGLEVIGVIENMSGFVCGHCGERTDIFGSGGGMEMAKDMGIPYLGSVPIDPAIVSASDSGKPYIEAYKESEAAKAFAAAIKPILEIE